MEQLFLDCVLILVLIEFQEVEWLSHSLGMGRTGIGARGGNRQMDGSIKHSQHSRHAHVMCMFAIGESGR